MDVTVDLYLAVPLLFTVLAIVLASVFVKLRGGEGQRAAERQPEPGKAEPGKAEPGREEPSSAAGGEAEPQGAAEGPGVEGSRVPVEEVGAGGEEKEKEKEEEKEEKEKEAAVAEQKSAAERSPESIPRPPAAAEHREQQQQEEEEEEESKEEDPDSDSEKLMVKETEDDDAADETFSFKYSPGKLRGNQYKSMMTKEELEEEQRTEDYMKLSLASS
ncbi:matrix-remodeling-associated protein 7 isoform X2 [Tympanuchus pallidicinctus]|uniref:matrix-remodeling-associated protein 7 isoform X2 n=1 Tax=Tympanuchus pallidicinctus TaxID=109042 RepID=UPI002286D353|nr:matrix-remodeling-associated protein 7 isoform X2 [Tympanuchus pallidicinctus]